MQILKSLKIRLEFKLCMSFGKCFFQVSSSKETTKSIQIKALIYYLPRKIIPATIKIRNNNFITFKLKS